MPDLTQLRSSTPEMPLRPLPSGPTPFRFSLDGVPERDRPIHFSEFLEGLGFRYDVEPLRDVPFEVDITLQALPGLQLMSGRLHGSRNRRTPETLADGTDDVGLMVNLSGLHLIAQGRREILLRDGEATFLSLAEPYGFTHRPPGDVLVLRFSREQFAPLVTGAEDCYLRRIPRGTPALKLLTDYVDIARDEQRIASRELQHLVVAHIYDLMAVAIGATRDAAQVAQGRGLRAARLHAIKQDIAGNLEQRDLSVAALAVRHRCTPRVIQRLFEAEGTTFTEYVLAQRLARAHRILLDPHRDGEKICAVAYDCGFGDVSYFNRMFRRRYGVAPSDIRAQARQAAPGGLM